MQSLQPGSWQMRASARQPRLWLRTLSQVSTCTGCLHSPAWLDYSGCNPCSAPGSTSLWLINLIGWAQVFLVTMQLPQRWRCPITARPTSVVSGCAQTHLIATVAEGFNEQTLKPAAHEVATRVEPLAEELNREHLQPLAAETAQAFEEQAKALAEAVGQLAEGLPKAIRRAVKINKVGWNEK